MKQNIRIIIMRFKEGMKPSKIAKIEKVHASKIYVVINRFKVNIKRLKDNGLQERDDMIPHPIFKYKRLKS